MGPRLEVGAGFFCELPECSNGPALQYFRGNRSNWCCFSFTQRARHPCWCSEDSGVLHTRPCGVALRRTKALWPAALPLDPGLTHPPLPPAGESPGPNGPTGPDPAGLRGRRRPLGGDAGAAGRGGGRPGRRAAPAAGAAGAPWRAPAGGGAGDGSVPWPGRVPRRKGRCPVWTRGGGAPGGCPGHGFAPIFFKRAGWEFSDPTPQSDPKTSITPSLLLADDCGSPVHMSNDGFSEWLPTGLWLSCANPFRMVIWLAGF